MNQYAEPQKISFKLYGGLENKNYPIDLRSTADFLIQFQHIVDKSFCVITGKERVTLKNKEDYQLLVKDIGVGSVSADLLLVVKGVALALPMMGFTNPKTIWDYACLSIEFFSAYSNALSKKQNPIINMTSSGDSSPVILNLQIGDKITNYPSEILPIAQKSLYSYKKMARAMINGNFNSFNAVSQDNNAFQMTYEDAMLYLQKNTIMDDAYSYTGNIIDFNKETMRGRVRILEGDFKNREFPFSVLGSQLPNPYIDAMNYLSVNFFAVAEINKNALETQVVRLHIMEISKMLDLT